jgi:hypothetical protein
VTSAPKTASPWESFSDPEKVKKWAKLLENAPERILREIETEGQHLRRTAMIRLWAAIAIFSAALIATVALALLGATLPASSTVGGGAVFVAVTLITGRAPRIQPSSSPNK